MLDALEEEKKASRAVEYSYSNRKATKVKLFDVAYMIVKENLTDKYFFNRLSIVLTNAASTIFITVSSPASL